MKLPLFLECIFRAFVSHLLTSVVTVYGCGGLVTAAATDELVLQTGSLRYGRLGNLRYNEVPFRTLSSCGKFSTGFWASGCIRLTNVTGVDTNGLEWTGVDIFSGKHLLTQIGGEE